MCSRIFLRLHAFGMPWSGKAYSEFFKNSPREYRLSQVQLNTISNGLLLFKGKFPSEFVRQPRSLSDLDKWKATEFREFLLYSGAIVLNPLLRGVVAQQQ